MAGKNNLFEKKPPKYQRYLEYEAITEWLDDLGSQKTIKPYMYRFASFLRYSKLSPDQLLEMDGEELKKIVKEYLNKKQKQGRQGMVHGVFNTINSFLNFHNKPIKWKRKEKRKYHVLAMNRVAQQHIPSNEEIYTMVDSARTTRNRAFLLCLWQSGVRNNCIRSWDYALVKDGLETLDEKGYIALKITAKYDSKISSYGFGAYHTFLNEEAGKALKAYIDYRKNIEGWQPKDDDKIFVTEAHEKAKRGKPLGKNVPSYIIKASARAIGLDPENITAHCFRKAFNMNLVKAGIQQNFITHFLGHNPSNSDGAYFDPNDVENLVKQYQKANWSREGVSRLNGIERELKQTKQEKEFLQEQVEQMREEMEEMRRDFQAMIREMKEIKELKKEKQ